MAPLLALGLSVLALAVLPRTARPGLLVAAAAIETAVVLQSVTGDAVLTAGGALVAAIVTLLVWQAVSTIAALVVPRQETVRRRAIEHRSIERRIAAEQRQERHEQRERRRAQGDDRAAA